MRAIYFACIYCSILCEVLYFRTVNGLRAACKMLLELTISTVLILLLGSSSYVTIVISPTFGSKRFFKAGVIVILLTPIFMITGYQYWVIHFGIIVTAV